jgi:hypothetical protein
MKRILWVTVLGSCWLGLTARAAEPSRPETLPGPRVLPAPPPAYLSAPTSFPRPSRYAVWQNYGVSRSGRFLPLVIYSPAGSYYYYNHEPFPWIATHAYEFAPFVVGPPQPAPAK